MSKKNTCCDPFKGYPPPRFSRWIRFTVWGMLAVVLLAMLVLASLEG